jgi:hypothetical protein
VMKESVNPVNQGISEENESEAAKNNTWPPWKRKMRKHLNTELWPVKLGMKILFF